MAGFRPSTARTTSPPLRPSSGILGHADDQDPARAPKYWPSSGLSGASSRSARGEPYRNGAHAELTRQVVLQRHGRSAGRRQGRIAEGKGPAARPAPEQDVGLIRGHHRTVLRSFPRRNSTGTVSLGASLAASSIRRRPGRDSRSPGFGLTARPAPTFRPPW